MFKNSQSFLTKVTHSTISFKGFVLQLQDTTLVLSPQDHFAVLSSKLPSNL